MEVPEVLRSGDHEAIERWRRTAARERTQRKRPDLVEDTTVRATPSGHAPDGTSR